MTHELTEFKPDLGASSLSYSDTGFNSSNDILNKSFAEQFLFLFANSARLCLAVRLLEVATVRRFVPAPTSRSFFSCARHGESTSFGSGIFLTLNRWLN